MADYEHGAFYYGLEREAIANLKSADVIILGNSRAQAAFSTGALRDFFATRGIKYFLLGFGYGELSDLPLHLMKRNSVRPKVLVINADPFFFQNFKTQPMAEIAKGARIRYLLKKGALELIATVCPLHPEICNSPVAVIYRSVLNGEWVWLNTSNAERALPFEFNESPFENEKAIDQWARTGVEFFKEFPIQRHCVVLTGVPAPGLSAGRIATSLAGRLGTELINVTVNDMTTMDQAHLSKETAERWSQAFLARLDPVLNECGLRGRQPQHTSM